MILIAIKVTDDKTQAKLDAKDFTPNEVANSIAQLEMLKLDLVSKLAKHNKKE